MCNNNNNNISDVLEVILLLQKNADCGDSCLDTCDKGFLSCGASALTCNTRPLMLYPCFNTSVPLSMPTSKSYSETEKSSIFRIEKLDGNTATFRVLTPNPDATDTQPFLATNSFFTMNLNCLCCLRCLNDTYVDVI